MMRNPAGKRLAFTAAAALWLALPGCASGTTETLAAQLQTFGTDLLRHLLAAWLL